VLSLPPSLSLSPSLSLAERERLAPVQALDMCRQAMALSVLALSVSFAASPVAAGRTASPQLLPKSTALALNALRLAPRPGSLVAAERGSPKKCQNGQNGAGKDPVDKQGPGASSKLAAQHAAEKRAREEALTLLCMAFDNAATVFECSGKKVRALSVVESSVWITFSGLHSLLACFAPAVACFSDSIEPRWVICSTAHANCYNHWQV